MTHQPQCTLVQGSFHKNSHRQARVSDAAKHCSRNMQACQDVVNLACTAEQRTGTGHLPAAVEERPPSSLHMWGAAEPTCLLALHPTAWLSALQVSWHGSLYSGSAGHSLPAGMAA